MKKTEEHMILKGYLRLLLRQFKSLQKALDNNEIDKAKVIISELIEDTEKNIED